MPSSAQERAEEISVRLCPGCGGHLADTWDQDAEECANCEFAYVRYETYSGEPYDSSPSAAYLAVGNVAGILSFLFALGAGQAMAAQQFVTATEGGVQIAAPGLPFAGATGLGLASLLLITFLIHRGDPR